MAIFTIGSALCGLAPNILFLIFSRAIQAIGGSLLEANTGAIIADTFEPDKRGRAYGYTGMSWTAGAVVGIVLGGVLTTFLDWRYIFFINLPIGIVGLIFGMRYLKDPAVVREDMDLAGMILLAAALSLISYGLIDFVGVGTSMANCILIAAGALKLMDWINEMSMPDRKVALQVHSTWSRPCLCQHTLHDRQQALF